MRRVPTLLLVLLLSLSTSGCELVVDILQFGFWAGVIGVLIILALAWGGFRMIQGMGRRGKGPRDEPPAV